MIRLYLDWNVLAQIKNGQHPELSNIIRNNDKFLKIFSTAHIGDIEAGYNGTPENEKQIQDDLLFLSQMTGDLCIYNNGKEIVVETYSPFSLFDQKKEPISVASPFDTSIFSDNPELQNKTVEYNQLLTKPLDGVIREALENPQTAEGMQQFYPGLHSNMTYGDLFRISMERFRSMNEGETYKSMRETMQKGLNVSRDKLFDDQNPFAMIDKIHEALPIDAKDRPSDRRMENVPEWFGAIVNAYVKLDMHGYQEDKVSIGKGRKQTFKNLTNDAFHAAFASSCDFYVTNDKKAYKKTNKVYEKLQVNTLVLKPDEFVSHYQQFLWLTEPRDHLLAFLKILQHGDPVVHEDETHLLRTFWLQHFLFDHFTRAHTLYDKPTGQWFYFLSKDKPTNGRWTFIKEIEQIMHQLQSFLGDDIDEFGDFNEQDNPEDWRGRRWRLDENAIIRLAFPNGWLQLYIDFENVTPEIGK